MVMKGWAEAQNYPGGITKYLFDKVKSLDSASGGDAADITELESDVGALQTTVGDSTGGLVKDVTVLKTAIGDESTEGTILARLKALEDAE